MAEPERWWIVGASEGLGRALARALDAEGAALALSARDAARLQELAGELRDARALPVDVTDAAAVARAAEQAGRVDGLVYSVGAYQPMSANDWETGVAVAMAEANFLGALRVVGAVLPGMLARDAGRIVLIGSLAGFRGLPGAIGYGASKAALMHLGENLRADLRGTGVRVQLVNPGFIDTRLTRQNGFRMPQLMTPERAAARTLRAIRSGRFSTSFPAPFSTLFQLGRHLPLRLFQALF
ncbi:SDR family NAD(P)-dependent oxidoreductase [Acidimangrovimonas pyrenivorans]|uniref:SDR family NAD(P)-dependent oxidoreductase n=1 Tax=Acidimangrovimonas pyrenivorans TaxID=2030798 RepID=A0ABV7AE37_9RHOB